MSEAHKRRGTRPPKAGRPWTAKEDHLCRTLRPMDVVRRTGRTFQAVAGGDASWGCRMDALEKETNSEAMS